MEELPMCIIEQEEVEHRKLCDVCKFPPKTCICSLFNKEPINNAIELFILQDPRESTNSKNTVCLLKRYFKNITIVKKCVPHKVVQDIQLHPKSYAVVFPRQDSIVIDNKKTSLLSLPNYKCLIVIDGTWEQAKSIYNRNEIFKQIDSVCCYYHVDRTNKSR